MPRKLLRVALVAAVIPALTPVMSFAQTAQSQFSARPVASNATLQKAAPNWWQRLRGEKATPATVNKPVVRPVARPAAKVVQVSGEQAAPRIKTASEMQAELKRQPVITPRRQLTAADFENVFPDDKPTVRRGRPAQPVPAEVAKPVAQAEVVRAVPVAVATPIQAESAVPLQAYPIEEATTPPTVTAVAQSVAQEFAPPAAAPQFEAAVEAYPIDSAAPPQDMTAVYSAPQGTPPQYNYVGMMSPDVPTNGEQYSSPVPGRPISTAMNGLNGAIPARQVPVPYGGPVGIARLDGALYPSPQPNIPFDVGTTMITNPALDPHEMLYAHRYRGLYGPFYHKTYRHWIMTPFGICKSEKRVLVGTEVRVNYKSYISPCSLFFPPVTH